MRIVIDANRAIAALIKDSTTRQILFDWNFEFVAPDHILIEIRKHEGSITKSTVISKDEFEILLALIFEHITIIPETEYKEFLELINKPITELELSVRSANCLEAANIKTIGDLVQKTEAQMLKYKNFGKKSLSEIQNILTGMNIHLGMNVQERLKRKKASVA